VWAGRKIVTASGSSHEEATRFLREEVEDFFTTLNKGHSQTTKPSSYQNVLVKIVLMFVFDQASLGEPDPGSGALLTPGSGIRNG
jgi:hypothetical protein